MKIEDIIGTIPDDMKDGEIITREYKGGKLVSEERKQTNWKPNAADLDVVQVQCKCGNTFEMDWDAVAFGGLGKNTFCGQCGKEGNMKVVES